MARRITAALASIAVGTIVFMPVVSADAKPAKTYKNCTALNKVYKHGVAKKGARDKVTSGKPVTTFKVSTKIYKAQKKTLDRDKDGVACEKK